MKKIDFNFKLTDLSGKEIPDFNVKESVANIIAGGSSRSPVRAMEIARKVFNDGMGEFVSEDIELMKNAILASTQISDLTKEQILKILE